MSALSDAAAPFSLASILNRLLWSAAQVRGRLSQENWRGLMEVQRETQALDANHIDLGNALELLNRLLMEVSALSGFALDDMTRDDGWRFLMIGRRLERLQFTADVLARVLHRGTAPDAATLEWLLELADSIITYRMRYLSSPQLIPVPRPDRVRSRPIRTRCCFRHARTPKKDICARSTPRSAAPARPNSVR